VFAIQQIGGVVLTGHLSCGSHLADKTFFSGTTLVHREVRDPSAIPAELVTLIRWEVKVPKATLATPATLVTLVRWEVKVPSATLATPATLATLDRKEVKVPSATLDHREVTVQSASLDRREIEVQSASLEHREVKVQSASLDHREVKDRKATRATLDRRELKVQSTTQVSQATLDRKDLLALRQALPRGPSRIPLRTVHDDPSQWPGVWAEIPPTNLQDAMDRLANAYYMFSGMTPIPKSLIDKLIPRVCACMLGCRSS